MGWAADSVCFLLQRGQIPLEGRGFPHWVQYMTVLRSAAKGFWQNILPKRQEEDV
jgi:hypothetical protein